MDINIFVNELEELEKTINDIIVVIENNITDGISKMDVLINAIKNIMPEWTYFINETQIGNIEDVFLILEDINKGIEASDSVLLLDALEYGLSSMVLEYIGIIKEALYEE